MNSEELSHLIGQNYGILFNPLPVDKFALVVQNKASINTDDASSQGSHKGGSKGEVNSNVAHLNATTVTTNPGTPLALVIASPATDVANTSSLENLQDNFVVQKGVLSLVNVDFNTNTHKRETSKHPKAHKAVSWRDMMKQNNVCTAPKPSFIWVPVLNSRGIEEKMKVTLEYSPLPYSCSLCQAFGHSITRWNDNPDKEQPQPKRQKPSQNRGKNANQEPINEVNDNVNETDNVEKNRGTDNAGDA
ncbi:hypothetical protein AgCh_010131 [Apium graveolens]